MEEQEIKNSINVWWEKAYRETDYSSQFVLFWRCFNAWLNYRSYDERITAKERKEGKDSDRKMIKWLKSSLAHSSDLRTIYEQLKLKPSFRQSLQILVDRPPVYDPRKPGKLIKIQNIDDFDNIVEAIYQIRCNLVHGNAEAQDPTDEKLVIVADEILKIWVSGLKSTWKL